MFFIFSDVVQLEHDNKIIGSLVLQGSLFDAVFHEIYCQTLNLNFWFKTLK